MRVLRMAAMAAAAGLVATGVTAQEAEKPDLRDAEVAHAAVTANAVDVELARLALERASDAEVKRFAETMIADHSSVNEQAAALAKKLGVTPEENAVSRDLQKGMEEAKARLQSLRGSAFDVAYMEREVAYHQAVLDALDGLLIPTTENGELRDLLTKVRPVIAAHLQHAEKIGARVGR